MGMRDMLEHHCQPRVAGTKVPEHKRHRGPGEHIVPGESIQQPLPTKRSRLAE